MIFRQINIRASLLHLIPKTCFFFPTQWAFFCTLWKSAPWTVTKSDTSGQRIRGKAKIVSHRFNWIIGFPLHRTPWHAAPLSPVGCALEPTVGLLNHSCDPNTCRVNIGRATLVYATRDIAEGEEVSELNKEGAKSKLHPTYYVRKKGLNSSTISISGDRQLLCHWPDSFPRRTEVRAPKEVRISLPMQVRGREKEDPWHFLINFSISYKM